jgi:quinol monooxygenase YgiN
MILFTVTILATPKSKDQILEILLSVKGPTEVEEGCSGCRLYQDIPNEYVITYEELWQREETLNNHIRSDLFRAVLAAIDLSSTHPKVLFNNISKISDLSLIERVLNKVDMEKKEWGKIRVKRVVTKDLNKN